MPRCRVYTMPDGTVRVVHPAPKSRRFTPVLDDAGQEIDRAWEPEAEWYARVMARTEEANPNLAGRPFADMDHADLPADRTQRARWRLQGGRVRVTPP